MTQSFSVHCTNFFFLGLFLCALIRTFFYLHCNYNTNDLCQHRIKSTQTFTWLYYCKVLECSCKSKRHIGNNSTQITNRLTFCKWMHGLFIWCCLDCPCVCGDLPFAVRKKAWIYLKFSPPWTVHYCLSFCLFKKGK